MDQVWVADFNCRVWVPTGEALFDTVPQTHPNTNLWPPVSRWVWGNSSRKPRFSVFSCRSTVVGWALRPGIARRQSSLQVMQLCWAAAAGDVVGGFQELPSWLRTLASADPQVGVGVNPMDQVRKQCQDCGAFKTVRFPWVWLSDKRAFMLCEHGCIWTCNDWADWPSMLRWHSKLWFACFDFTPLATPLLQVSSSIYKCYILPIPVASGKPAMAREHLRKSPVCWPQGANWSVGHHRSSEGTTHYRINSR
jgi:hypothetical protein